MKLPIMTVQRTPAGEMQLPVQFQEEYRPDLIKRAVHALQSKARQPYGASPEAGLRHSHYVSKRRRNYRTSYGKGISRVARKIHIKRGSQLTWVGTFSPQTVGGRRAHPPKAQKIWVQKINQKENQKAIRSAMAATVNKQLVQQRGHQVPAEYPFIIDSAVEEIKKTPEMEKILAALGFDAELERAAQKKVRAGKGKMRGRRYNKKKGPLIVVSKECSLMQAAGNIPGVDIVPVRALNAAVLAPGTFPGRITLWTESAIMELEKNKLFI
ncbi:MAG: 50S ribosomal protein L4 [Nanoarchaeota archaeon]